ncbi:hypothetical protein D3H55_20385 [Bacillus salacetis]|uniref:Uncharacterized protein n=1 Tax=Bacillus salacetis TaxID=2315464 RepID=A0A3A1QPD5_9BACI|nr:CBO0543 family protein [Bacillus salacetis]RIW28928.1 hypothetical protein D3H55_20385 [Bacillus salacetis]
MGYPTKEDINKVDNLLTDMRLENFVHEDFLTPQWWFLLSLLVLPWIVWWFLVDKSRIKQIWLFGVLLSILIIYLDDIGSELDLWNYPIKLVNIVPRLNPIDISVLPVMHMLIYQYFTRWKPFIAANLIMSLFNSYIAEPFFVKINIYELTNWEYSYSVPIYILKAILIKALLEKVLQKSKR